jgi:predicted alpha/beta-hydrolase family hydrolase
MPIVFEDDHAELPIRGFLHEARKANGDGIGLTHGAGGDCRSKLLVAISDALADLGFTVLRFDLPFRLARRFGPPFRGAAEQDRNGLRRAAAILRDKLHGGRLFLGGHSYGGRQASILASEDPKVADGLFLLSYPLHPPRKPTELRTDHFPKLTKPAFFVHGVRDDFATSAEMQTALQLIPALHSLFEVEGAGHELFTKKNAATMPSAVAISFQNFVNP